MYSIRSHDQRNSVGVCWRRQSSGDFSRGLSLSAVSKGVVGMHGQFCSMVDGVDEDLNTIDDYVQSETMDLAKASFVTTKAGMP